MAFDTVAVQRPALHLQPASGFDLDLAIVQAESTARIICHSMRTTLAAGNAASTLEDHSSAAITLRDALQRAARGAREIGEAETGDALERWATLAETVADRAIGSDAERRQALDLAEVLAQVVRIPEEG